MPTQIASFTNVVSVAAGFTHSLALKADGSVWSFGSNGSGELGDGTTTPRTTPVQVVGLSGVVAIAAGDETSYALQADGAGGGWIWAWGKNNHHQLGDGSTLPRVTPVRVSGIATARLLAAGEASALVALADGRVLAWGRNQDGQLATGTTVTQATPVEVPAVSAVWAIAAGSRHMVAADRAARVWGWGDNGEGELGTGAAVAAAAIAPERSDLAGALALAAHDQHTVAVMPDGTVQSFGNNAGRLGNGGTALSAIPVTAAGLSLATNTWLTGDADGDGLATWREYLLGLDPLDADTNRNGIPDGADEASGLDARDPDHDGDGVPNWVEATQGTDPFNADSDGDTYDDGEDDFPLDAGRHEAPAPNPSDTTPPVITLKEPVSATPVPPPQ